MFPEKKLYICTQQNIKFASMGTINGIIGRQREIALLQEIYESPRAEFVAV